PPIPPWRPCPTAASAACTSAAPGRRTSGSRSPASPSTGSPAARILPGPRTNRPDRDPASRLRVRAVGSRVERPSGRARLLPSRGERRTGGRGSCRAGGRAARQEPRPPGLLRPPAVLQVLALGVPLLHPVQKRDRLALARRVPPDRRGVQ